MLWIAAVVLVLLIALLVGIVANGPVRPRRDRGVRGPRANG
jgi:hypothetical protein